MSIRSLRKDLEGKFGAGVVSFMEEKATAREAYSTSVLSIDYGLVVGGYPKGYWIELYGKEGCCKSSLAATVAASVQAQGKFVLWLDYENSFDQAYFAKLGVQYGEDKFMVAWPATLEDGFRIIVQVMLDKSIPVGLIVIDSLAMAAPDIDVEKLEEKLGKTQMGSTARPVSQIIKQITPLFQKRKDVSMLIINQVRNVIGGWITTQETTGGLALKYATHVRQVISRIGLIKEGGKPVGMRMKIKVAKSKVGVPMREVETDFIFGKGFDIAADAFGIAKVLGVLIQAGAMYSIAGTEYKVKGLNGFRETWDADEAFRKVVRERVLACDAQEVAMEGEVEPVADDEVPGVIGTAIAVIPPTTTATETETGPIKAKKRKKGPSA